MFDEKGPQEAQFDTLTIKIASDDVIRNPRISRTADRIARIVCFILVTDPR